MNLLQLPIPSSNQSVSEIPYSFPGCRRFFWNCLYFSAQLTPIPASALSLGVTSSRKSSLMHLSKLPQLPVLFHQSMYWTLGTDTLSLWLSEISQCSLLPSAYCRTENCAKLMSRLIWNDCFWRLYPRLSRHWDQQFRAPPRHWEMLELAGLWPSRGLWFYC